VEEWTVNKTLQDAPEPGLTVTVAVPAAAIRLAGTVAVNCVALL
jgi:hypothetical protein